MKQFNPLVWTYFSKAVTHKYVSRHKVGNRYRYTYAKGDRHGKHSIASHHLGQEKHLKVGSAFSAGPERGHFIVDKIEGDRVTFHVDEIYKGGPPGKSTVATKKNFLDMVSWVHESGAKVHAGEGIQKRLDVLERAKKHGTEKHIDRAKKHVEQFAEKHGAFLEEHHHKAVKDALQEPKPEADFPLSPFAQDIVNAADEAAKRPKEPTLTPQEWDTPRLQNELEITRNLYDEHTVDGRFAKRFEQTPDGKEMKERIALYEGLLRQRGDELYPTRRWGRSQPKKPLTSPQEPKPEKQGLSADEQRQREEAARKSAEKRKKAEPTGKIDSFLDHFSDVVSGVLEGKYNAEDLKASFQLFVDRKDEVKAELRKKTKAQLLKFAVTYADMSDKKDRLVQAAYEGILSRHNFHPNDNGMIHGVGEEAHINSIKKWVDGITDQHLETIRGKRAKAIAEKERAETNPQTPEEWSRALQQRGGVEGAPEEDLVAHDEAHANDARQAQEALLEQRAKERAEYLQKQASVPVGQHEGATIHKGTHSKKGHDIWTVQLGDRVGPEEFKNLKNKARSLGGYYSSYRGGGAVPGFIFKDSEQAKGFASHVGGEEVDLPPEPQAPKPEPIHGNAPARLKELGQAKETAGKDDFSTDRKTHTDRYARQAAASTAKAQKEIEIGQTMQNIAARMEDETIQHLWGVRHASHVELLDRLATGAVRKWADKESDGNYSRYEALKGTEPTTETIRHAAFPYPHINKDVLVALKEQIKGLKGSEMTNARRTIERALDAIKAKDGKPVVVRHSTHLQNLNNAVQAVKKKKPLLYDSNSYSGAKGIADRLEDYNRLQKMGITNEAHLRAALREYVGLRGQAPKVDKTKQRAEELARRKIPGYFPTPAGVVDRMIEHADISAGMKVLEPSAGAGHIADQIKEQGVNPDVIEYNTSLADLLKEKGHKVVGSDALEHTGEYDRVLMNPPFERNKEVGWQDIAHVQHAYNNQLAPGGKLVAVVSAGALQRNDKQSKAFQDWLDDNGATIEDNPEGAFKDSDRKTGVNTKLVVIDKPSYGHQNAAKKAKEDGATTKEETPTSTVPPKKNAEEAPKQENPAAQHDRLEKQAAREMEGWQARRDAEVTRYANISTKRLLELSDRNRKQYLRGKGLLQADPDSKKGKELVEKFKPRWDEARREKEQRQEYYRIARKQAAIEEVKNTGKLTIHSSEKAEMLAKEGDAYRDAGLKPPFDYAPEHFHTSDLSGRGIRRYVTLPDGRKAHPDELHEAQERGRIVVYDEHRSEVDHHPDWAEAEANEPKDEPKQEPPKETEPKAPSKTLKDVGSIPYHGYDRVEAGGTKKSSQQRSIAQVHGPFYVLHDPDMPKGQEYLVNWKYNDRDIKGGRFGTLDAAVQRANSERDRLIQEKRWSPVPLSEAPKKSTAATKKADDYLFHPKNGHFKGVPTGGGDQIMAIGERLSPIQITNIALALNDKLENPYTKEELGEIEPEQIFVHNKAERPKLLSIFSTVLSEYRAEKMPTHNSSPVDVEVDDSGRFDVSQRTGLVSADRKDHKDIAKESEEFLKIANDALMRTK